MHRCDEVSESRYKNKEGGAVSCATCPGRYANSSVEKK